MNNNRFHEYTELLSQYWHKPRKALTIVINALKNNPRSAELWNIRGDIISMLLFNQRTNEILLSSGVKYTRKDVLNCYRKALELNPKYATAYESIGYYHDVITNCLRYAEPAFRKAILYGAGIDSYIGLARVLAQQNRTIDALTILKKYKYPKDSKIITMKSEIINGYWGEI